MKKLRSQLLRWTLIVRKIQSRPYLSFRELQREIERELYFRGCEPACSEATLKRDLSELREDFGIEIVYDRARNGYRIRYVDKEWLDVDQLMEPLEILTALGAEDGLPDYILPEKYPVKGAQHLSGMIYAIRHARKIGFHYRKYSDGSSSERILSPYVLKEWRGRWYVIGKEQDVLLDGIIDKNLSKLEKKVVSAFTDGFSYDEIAEKNGITVKSVDNALQRARAKLAKYLQR